MHRFTRHLRGLLVALATLALSAGVVLAARPASVEAPPTQAADGLKIATEASGQTVPVRVDAASGSRADEDQDEDADSEAPKADAGAEGDTAANAAERKQNHGWFVSQAAHAATAAAAAATTAATPGSHGLAVSTIARSDAGKPAAATAAAASKPAKPTKTPKATSH